MLDFDAVSIELESASFAEVPDQVEDFTGADSFVIGFAGPLAAESLVVLPSSGAAVQVVGDLDLAITELFL